MGIKNFLLLQNNLGKTSIRDHLRKNSSNLNNNSNSSNLLKNKIQLTSKLFKVNLKSNHQLYIKELDLNQAREISLVNYLVPIKPQLQIHTTSKLSFDEIPQKI